MVGGDPAACGVPGQLALAGQLAGRGVWIRLENGMPGGEAAGLGGRRKVVQQVARRAECASCRDAVDGGAA